MYCTHLVQEMHIENKNKLKIYNIDQSIDHTTWENEAHILVFRSFITFRVTSFSSVSFTLSPELEAESAGGLSMLDFRYLCADGGDRVAGAIDVKYDSPDNVEQRHVDAVIMDHAWRIHQNTDYWMVVCSVNFTRVYGFKQCEFIVWLHARSLQAW